MIASTDVIEDTKRALGCASDGEFADLFRNLRDGSPLTRPAVRHWRRGGVPMGRVAELAYILDERGVEWPESFRTLHASTFHRGNAA